MFAFWPEKAAMLGAESFGVCGAVKMERKWFQIDLRRCEDISDDANIVGVSKYSK